MAEISLDKNVARHSMMKKRERRQCVLQADRLIDLSPSLNLPYCGQRDIPAFMVSTFQNEVTVELDPHCEI